MSRISASLAEDGGSSDRALLLQMLGAGSGVSNDAMAVQTEGPAGVARRSFATSAQTPLRHSPADDDGLLVAADIRLDNREELISTLFEAGAPAPPSDSELVARAYRHWGTDSPSRLVGDFAFAVWDIGRRRLFCARDAMGVKPLHYLRTGERLIVASEVQQILADPSVGRELDEQFLGRYLAGALQTPGRTPFDAIRSVPSAHFLTAESGQLRIERYWQPDTGSRIVCDDPREYVERFDALLRRSVRDRLRDTGAAAGIQLSGGLDSSTVAATAAAVRADLEPAPRLLALSAVFDELKECDESPLIRSIVRQLELEGHEFHPEQEWLLRDPERYPPDLETPFMGWAAVEHAMLAQLASSGGRVLLTGHGGDQVLYGSPLQYADLLRRGRLLRLLRDLGTHARRKQVTPWRLAYLYLAKPLLPGWLLALARRTAGRPPSRPPRWLSPRVARACDWQEAMERSTALVSHGGARGSLARQAAYLGDIAEALSWIERTATRYGIEARHPLLDRRLAEFAVAVPPELHYRAGSGKQMLRRAMRGRLPENVRRRQTKTLFRPLLDFSLRQREHRRVEALFKDPLLAQLGLVDRGQIRDEIAAFLAGGDGPGALCWRLVTAEIWLQTHFREHRDAPPGFSRST